jgi:hypothetical protein
MTDGGLKVAGLWSVRPVLLSLVARQNDVAESIGEANQAA